MDVVSTVPLCPLPARGADISLQEEIAGSKTESYAAVPASLTAHETRHEDVLDKVWLLVGSGRRLFFHYIICGGKGVSRTSADVLALYICVQAVSRPSDRAHLLGTLADPSFIDSR